MLLDPVLGTTYCVLDGVDECEESSMKVLLQKIRDIFSTKSEEPSPYRLKVIVVSREIPDFIPELLSSFPRIRLDPDPDSVISGDIHRFIDVRVDELSEKRHYPEQLRLSLKEAFRRRP